MSALSDATEQLRHVREHIAAVLRKYPQETIPENLAWGLIPRADAFMRLSRDGLFVRLVIKRFMSEARASIPVSLLTAPQQDIHVWARSEYWKARHEKKERELRERAATLARLRQDREHARISLARLDARITELDA